MNEGATIMFLSIFTGVFYLGQMREKSLTAAKAGRF